MELNMKFIGEMSLKSGIAFILPVMLGLICQGCSREVALPIQTIEVSRSEIVVPGFGASYDIDIQANTSWRLSIDGAEWIESDLMEATGLSSMTLNVLPNETNAERSASVVVMSLDTKVSREVKITQLPVLESGRIPISAVRGLERSGEYVFPTGSVSGFVSCRRENGNVPENTLFIQDSFTKTASGIALKTPDMPDFIFGDYINAELTGAVLKRSADGYLVLELKSMPVPGVCSSLEVHPLKLTFGDLTNGDYESMLVTLDKFQVTASYTEGIFADSPMLENRAGENVMMSVRPDALFAESSYQKGYGPVTGIVLSSRDRLAISPQDSKDVEFGIFRIGEQPGIKSLPYAFSFYCSERTDEKPKYINYNQLTWVPSTKMMKGVIAEDKDPFVGVSLEMSAFASDLSKTIYGQGVSNMWAEDGAHDNVNAAGFVSPDGKTKPTSECGFWLNVPLQTDLPPSFNVFFGLAGNDWSISDWKLSYSKDKREWFSAADVHIDHVCSYGSYYQRFCVNVTPSMTFEADDTLYLKLTPFGTQGCNPANTAADGHGSSCFIRLHSAILIQDASAVSTPVPEGAVYFEPFDRLTEGVGYLYGERNAGLANFCGSDISAWSTEVLAGMKGTNVRQRPGYAQIGYVNDETTGNRYEYENQKGSLTTAALGKSGDFTLSFKAGAYRSPAIRPNASELPDIVSADITSAVISIQGGGTIDGRSKITVSDLPADYTFKEYSFRINRATANTTITFTSEPPAKGFSRWFIDDILIK